MAIIVGPGAQAGIAKGRIGSTVLQRAPKGSPAGTALARTHAPWPTDPGALIPTARRVLLSYAAKTWSGTTPYATIPKTDWNEYATRLKPGMSGALAYSRAFLRAASRGHLLDPSNSAYDPTLGPHQAAVLDVTASYDPDTRLCWGTAEIDDFVPPYLYLAVMGAPGADPPSTSLPSALFLSPRWDAGGAVQPIPFALRVPPAEVIPGATFSLRFATIGPGYEPGTTDFHFFITFPA